MANYANDLVQLLGDDVNDEITTANSPSLRMVVPDTEPMITIDSDLRTITVPDELYNIGVVGDKFAETVYFKCPRLFDGIDLYERNCVIEFINAAGQYGSSNAIDVVTLDADFIKFGWEIDSRVTQKSGVISFAVYFRKSDGRGYQWGTTPAALNVLNGLDIPSTISDKDNSILIDVLTRLDEFSVQIETMKSDIMELKLNISKIRTFNEELKNDVENNKSKITILKDNAMYFNDISGLI